MRCDLESVGDHAKDHAKATRYSAMGVVPVSAIHQTACRPPSMGTPCWSTYRGISSSYQGPALTLTNSPSSLCVFSIPTPGNGSTMQRGVVAVGAAYHPYQCRQTLPVSLFASPSSSHSRIFISLYSFFVHSLIETKLIHNAPLLCVLQSSSTPPMCFDPFIQVSVAAPFPYCR